ncbi:hypothetical protein [Ciceribacter sp. L1K22]|uniref:hypothetical protein n=1 Tax=Ciceribacter sp. L1K22 TaxID=2820275 RepID=UPI001ABE0D00|nr:hypothetical protein [Ciceribacter sp. L1K22]MBO3760028.1 hypothetical protein [Ciceribacter sp. L1K22]
MAFTGLHVTAGYVGPLYNRGRTQNATLLSNIVNSQTLTEAGTTTLTAPGHHDSMGAPVFRIQAAADSWVSIGVSPNASSGVRTLCRAGQDYDLFVEPGDKVAWVAA